MKIVQCITQMEAGGAQRVAMLLAEAFAARGHDVQTWFLYVKRPVFDAPHVRVICANRPRGVLTQLQLMSRLQLMLLKENPEVFISHTHYANVLGQLAAFLARIPVRIPVQHNALDTYPPMARIVDGVLDSIGAYTSNVAVSQSVVNAALRHNQYYAKGLSCIYNGLPHPHISSDRVSTRAAWGLPLESPLIINVGRLSKQKNQATLIKSLASLPNAHAAIVGEGEMRQELERLAESERVESRLHLLGEVPSQTVHDLVGASDVFAFPSLFEAMPMALLEAMAIGIPIVASDIPSTRETLGGAGVLTPVSNALALAGAISRVLDSEELALKCVALGRKRVSGFSIESMVDSYEAIIRGGMPANPRSRRELRSPGHV